MKTKAQELLRVAKEEASKAETWADFSNFLFDQESGILAGVFPTEAERREFIATPEFKAIRQLIAEVRERTGLIEGATPKKTGRHVVRLPETLHVALESEATKEGVSFGQLVVAKLSLQMGQTLSTSAPQ